MGISLFSRKQVSLYFLKMSIPSLIDIYLRSFSLIMESKIGCFSNPIVEVVQNFPRVTRDLRKFCLLLTIIKL